MNAKMCNKDKKGMQIPDYLVFIKSVESWIEKKKSLNFDT